MFAVTSERQIFGSHIKLWQACLSENTVWQRARNEFYYCKRNGALLQKTQTENSCGSKQIISVVSILLLLGNTIQNLLLSALCYALQNVNISV